MTQHDEADPRAKYRLLPPVTRPQDVIETVDVSRDSANDIDENEGARPYLRTILGPQI